MDTILDLDERVALTKWHIQEKQLDKALIQLKHVLEEDQTNDEATLIAARLYAQLQLFKHSQALFETYLQNNKDDINAHFQLGMCYFDQNDNAKALSTWKGILQFNKSHPPALFYSAIALLKENKPNEASPHLKFIIESVPMDNLYYNKAKELLVQIDNQAQNLGNVPVDNVYKTEH